MFEEKGPRRHAVAAKTRWTSTLVLARFRHKYLPADPDCDLLITKRPTEKTSEDPGDTRDEDLDEGAGALRSAEIGSEWEFA